MSFNNFPIGYQPQYYQRPTTSRIWVQGEEGAKSYLVAPNSSVDLWDSEKMVIYAKSADASGMPTMRTIDYTYRENKPESKDDYVTHSELNEFKNYFDGKISELGGADDE